MPRHRFVDQLSPPERDRVYLMSPLRYVMYFRIRLFFEGEYPVGKDHTPDRATIAEDTTCGQHASSRFLGFFPPLGGQMTNMQGGKLRSQPLMMCKMLSSHASV